MTRYCKAYKLEDLRKFPQWADSAKESEKHLHRDYSRMGSLLQGRLEFFGT